MKQKTKATVISQREIAENIFDMWIETGFALQSGAGQFIGVYPKDKSRLLPRPISICQTEKGTRPALRIVYRTVGGGTEEFSTYKEGDSIDILGNLGNGFPLEAAKGKRVFIIGGGIGVPPMLELSEQLRECEKQIILGYRDCALFLKEEFERNGMVYIATEDGSAGTRGNVLDAIKANGLSADVIYACGPMPMLRAIKMYAEEKGIDAYISLEEHMACGVGACLGCVVKTANVDRHSHVNNARICTDGPVFEAKEVDI
ncbi:MAG: dihydroorotate dehydrogenase electron transfer subunit [Lachnospiraceae bacterium]|nr:dihydroorotate dehydrogenase electron transfer subunit [Lachnospiraceae bacterium]